MPYLVITVVSVLDYLYTIISLLTLDYFQIYKRLSRCAMSNQAQIDLSPYS